MNLNKHTKILIVGLGVIGGGYAEALSRQGYTVDCITKHQADIDYALEKGMIKRGFTEPDPTLLSEAELIVLALYPHTMLSWLRAYGHLLNKAALVTDVTGVKAGVVEEAQSILGDDGPELVPAHPMAGREASGVAFADSSVFHGANFLITPTARNTEESIRTVEELGRVLGFARIVRLSPLEHDRMIAHLSQLTHAIAVALMTCNETPGLEQYTGDSFRDLTRIARINDEMWSELFLCNRDALLYEMDAFLSEFNRLRESVACGDRESMRRMMRLSTARRALFDKPTPGKETHS